jgi:hypothetical protein
MTWPPPRAEVAAAVRAEKERCAQLAVLWAAHQDEFTRRAKGGWGFPNTFDELALTILFTGDEEAQP